MAGSGNRDSGVKVKVWTFVIEGGERMGLTLPNNPALVHDGRKTLWKLVGTKETADTAAGLIRSLGATLTILTEEESVEQRAERDRILHGDLQ